MRDHVLGMAGVRGDHCVAPGCALSERGMGGVVVGVNHVMDDTRMIGVRGERLLEQGGRLHVEPDVTALIGEAHHRQSVKRAGIDVVRIGVEQPFICRHKRGRARTSCPLRRAPQPPPAIGPRGRSRLGRARRGRRPKPGEHGTRRLWVLLGPQRMIVGHGLAPIGHDEARIGGLRLSKCFSRGRIFEIVKQREATEERSLGGRLPLGEMDLADAHCRWVAGGMLMLSDRRGRSRNIAAPKSPITALPYSPSGRRLATAPQGSSRRPSFFFAGEHPVDRGAGVDRGGVVDRKDVGAHVDGEHQLGAGEHDRLHLLLARTR